MTEIIQRLSNYRIFNHLLPGVLFCTLIDRFTQYTIMQNNMLTDICICYFIGLCISRIGSLIVWDFLRAVKILRKFEYKDFLKAKKEAEIGSLLEVANMYRSILTMFLLFCAVKFYELIDIKCLADCVSIETLLLFGFILLFLCVYVRQEKYVAKRIILSKRKKRIKNKNNR